MFLYSTTRIHQLTRWRCILAAREFSFPLPSFWKGNFCHLTFPVVRLRLCITSSKFILSSIGLKTKEGSVFFFCIRITCIYRYTLHIRKANIENHFPMRDLALCVLLILVAKVNSRSVCLQDVCVCIGFGSITSCFHSQKRNKINKMTSQGFKSMKLEFRFKVVVWVLR